MRNVIIIPARYNSSRFPGKPLANICGKPMIWWVYSSCSKVNGVDGVFVATDDERIVNLCNKLHLDCVLTSSKHETSTERVYEVANRIDAECYIVVNGDEPLISSKEIEAIIPKKIDRDIFVRNLMTKIKDPVEAVDSTNIKVVTDCFGNAMFFSRQPIPFPKANMNYSYYKHVGVIAYNFQALEFFSNTNREINERIEDINELRYIEHGIRIEMIEVDYETLSVDNAKDIETVERVIKEKNIMVER